ncbi:RHS repeat-associated core domain-containing protein [Lentisphaerota bacterium WC36G]|nr:RHS repeat-associated core domain-containing protein [Lentisphaerae bacterium WC36]
MLNECLKLDWLGDNLLALEKDGVVFNYIADGNKNITQLIDMSSGSIANRYDYSPFGQLSKNNETVANPFRFSSEYAEKETGLVYYNYRYYNPVNGKWLKRDPIEEDGGMNVYGFVNNNSVSYYDNLGNSMALGQSGPYSVGGNSTDARPNSSGNHSGGSSGGHGGTTSSPYMPGITGPRNTPQDNTSSNAGVACSFLLGEFSMSTDNKGCTTACISITSSLAGAGASAGVGDSKTPISIYAGICKYAGASGVTDGTINISGGISLSSPIGVTIRLGCFKVNEKDNDGCPCPDPLHSNSNIAGVMFIIMEKLQNQKKGK